MNLEQRLMRKAIPEPNSGCWIWVGCTDSCGYGQIRINGRNRRTHRVAYETFRCDIPSGLELDHLCRVRCCINPDHLEPVTKSINILRGTRRQRVDAASPELKYCKHGHELTPENVYHTSRGWPRCKTCKREAFNRWLTKNRATSDK